MEDAFPIVDNLYVLTNETKLKLSLIRTVTNGIKTASHIGPQNWKSIPCKAKVFIFH